ncbi:zinc finger C2HC domain-containing protein 1C-like [Sphaeramia orbicularis]|uniref:zinc finger C2HC domain-containing protein 1C-like n=1 Tax=Sphaeramia orbicularis TaxID=375764 RepID=UPI00117BFB83|nr:zinc finger C2HC domain-containing protein 1C [Sphaeramia orbicularis]
MSTTSRGSSLEKNSAGLEHGSVHSEEKHGTTPGRRADHVNKPFPNKPMSHKRPHNPTSRDSLEHNNLEKVSISKKSSAPSHFHEYMSNSIRRETTGSRQPDKEYHRQIHGEMQMARAIHAKQLVLQEKLWRVEEKIRLKIQLESAAAAGDGQKSGQEGKDYKGRGETETRQRREPEKRREVLMPEEEGEKRKQDQRKGDRMIKKCEEQEAKWDRREIKDGDYIYSEIKGSKGTREGTVHEEDDRKELKGGKEETEKDNRVWEHTNVRSNQGKAGDRERSKTSKVDEALSREKNYSAHNDDMNEGPQMSQQKSAPENHRVAERKVTEEPSAPQVSFPSPSSTHQEEESEVANSTDGDLQLVPCRICNRNFTSQRVEKHVKICEKVKQSQRPVFNSYNNRTKGSALEDYLKTHSRSKTPEVLLKKTKRQNMKKQHQSQPPAGASKLKWSK